MTNRNHAQSLSRQAELLGISRGSLYYQPRPGSEDDLKLMRRIDELHMEYPFAPSRDIALQCPAGQRAAG